jgi:hypothetical protein
VSLHDVTTEGAVNDFVTGTQLAFFNLSKVHNINSKSSTSHFGWAAMVRARARGN